MTQRGTNMVRDALLEQWRSEARWQRFLLPGDFFDKVRTVSQRFLLPGDFFDKVRTVSEEGFCCHKTTNEYLTMSEHTEAKTLTISQSKRYSCDFNYRPSKFRDEIIGILSGAARARCGNCTGVGTVACDNCSGNGRVPCPIDMHCPECGWVGRKEKGCLNCRDSGIVHCNECAGTGTRECDGCNSGRVECPDCDGDGIVVRGNVITRSFRSSTEVSCQLDSLPADQYKNGLELKHFQSMEGDVVQQECQQPSRTAVVLQRRTVQRFEVMSRRYQYSDKEFCLNMIKGVGPRRFVSIALPLSGFKIGVAAFVLGVPAFAIGLTTVLL